MDRVTGNLKSFSRMSDGRAFTDYTANCIINRKMSGKNDSYEYRQKLISTGSDLLDAERKTLGEKYICDGCNKAIIPTEMFVQSCSKGNCYINKISENGIGIRQQ